MSMSGATRTPTTNGPRDDGRAGPGGHSVTALVHGADYFARLLDVFGTLGPGDMVLFTDWRGDGDERLNGDEGTEVATVLVDLVRRGVDVRGLVWRSHPDEVRFSEEEAVALAEAVNEAGGEVLLDERVRRAGSHHQKLVLVPTPAARTTTSPSSAGSTCATAGATTSATPATQAVAMDERYGETPPWHDVQLEIRGPAVGDLAATFRERWDDPTPLDHRNPWRAPCASVREPRRPEPLPPLPAAPGPAGEHAVQVLRTYPAKRPPYPFAPDGERSIARAYIKAFARARRLIYVEDQYLWSATVAGPLAEALRSHPELRLIALVPRYPEQGGLLSEPPSSSVTSRRSTWCARPEATASRSTTWRTTRARPSTCTPRRAWSTTCGRPSGRTTSTCDRGPTTRSCPAR